MTVKSDKATRARRTPTRVKNAEREKVVQGIWRAASAHVQTLETRLAAATEPDESGARTMAVLVKTLRELEEFGDGNRKRKHGTEPKSDQDGSGNDDPGRDDPREIDEFRRELARRIAALDAGAADETAGGV